MASERTRRRIQRLLDQIDAADARWSRASMNLQNQANSTAMGHGMDDIID